LDAFLEDEKNNAEKALQEGSFGKLLKTLSKIKVKDSSLLRIATLRYSCFVHISEGALQYIIVYL
jgi:hypothetical protein